MQLKLNRIFGLSIDRSQMRFLLIFGAVISALYGFSVIFEGYVPIFNIRATSVVLSKLLGMLGLVNTLSGNVLSFGDFSIEIVRQCTGVFEAIAITASIIAYHAKPDRKAAGIMGALVVIYVFNMLRLTLLSYVGVLFHPIFDAIHEYFFQTTFVLLVVFQWAYWVEGVRNDGKEAADDRQLKEGR
jgi:archaeosortase B (VPXXXP-CTERM-specific)